MALDDPTWEDTGFDPDAPSSGGFLPSEPEGRRRVPAEPPSKPERPERKGKGALFWFGIVAVAVLLIAVIGGGFYWLSLPTAEEQAFFAKSPGDAADTEVVQPEPAPSSDLDSELEVRDTSIKHEEEALDLLFGQDNSQTADKTVATAKQPKADQATPKATATTPKTAATTPKTAATTPKTTPPPAKTVPAPTSSQALYVVQVFSSQSRDDAEEWLQLLRQKNIADGYVTEQKIKSVSWYRVRFGRFTSRRAAEDEAIRLGFKQPWIARVK